METIFEVERTATGEFVARDAFGIDARGVTEAEAVGLLRERIAERVRAGIRRRDSFAAIPDRPGFGILRDNPMFDEWKQAMVEARAEIEADPDRL